MQHRLWSIGRKTLPRPVDHDCTLNLIDSTGPSASACGLRATALEPAFAGVTLTVNRDCAAAGGDLHAPASGGSNHARGTCSPIPSCSRAG